MSGIRVRLPDGSTITVQGTDDPKAAAAAAQKHWQQRQEAALPKRSLLQQAEDSFLDNVLPNWGDEVEGLGRGIGNVITGNGSFSDGFRAGQKAFQSSQQQFKRDHPALSKVASGTGMAASLALPVGDALEGASLARKAAQGARVGAAYSAASGAGEGDGLDLARRGTNALHGAATGAVAGAALPVVGTGAGKVGRLARQYIPGVDAAVRTLPRVPRAIIQAATGRRNASEAQSAGTQQANRIAAQRMRDGNIANGLAIPGPQASPEAIQAELALRHAAGVPAMIGDTTEAMRGLTGYTSRGMGPGQTMVRDALARRQATAGDRMRQHVIDTMPTVPDPVQFVEQQRQAARDATAPLYAQAYAQPMYRTQAIQAIEQTPAFRDALPQAYRNVRNQIDPTTGQSKSHEAMGFRDMVYVDPAGLPPNVAHFPHPSGHGYVAVDPNGLSFEGYDQVVRAMQDQGRAAADRNPVTGRIENNTNSVHINARAAELRDLLRQQNPAYDQAVGRYGDDMAYTDAFRRGGDIGSLTGHEVNAQARMMPQHAHQAFATGAGTALADEASKTSARYPNGDAANRVRQMLGDDVKQQALGDIAGNTGNVRDLLDRLEYEHQGHLNWQGVNGNSATAARQALDRDMDGSLGLPTSKAGWLGSLVDFVTSHAATQYQRDLKQHLGKIVTASDPQSVEHAMNAINEQALRDRKFGDLLHKGGIGVSTAYGSNIAPSDPVDQGGARGGY